MKSLSATSRPSEERWVFFSQVKGARMSSSTVLVMVLVCTMSFYVACSNSEQAIQSSNRGIEDLQEDMSPSLDMLPHISEDMSLLPTLYSVGSMDSEIMYTTMPPTVSSEMRTISLRIRYPLQFEASAPIILISHGGAGNLTGHQKFSHIGEELASHGYIAVHINHQPSKNNAIHRWDRPNDVRTVLDVLIDGSITLSEEYQGSMDFERVGHLGHSWGAYTAHAVAGALFESPVPNDSTYWNFRDERIDAIVTISPQGWGQFGSFDDVEAYDATSLNNSWQSVNIPVLSIIGELEMDGVVGVEENVPNTFRTENWRLIPFARYPADGARHACILSGQNHANLGGDAASEINTYIAKNSRQFFDVYLRGRSFEREQIGALAILPQLVCQNK